jgi:hypothetical protein
MPAFRSLWVRGPREVAGLTEPPIAAAMELSGSRLQYHATVPPTGAVPTQLLSTLGVAADGSVHAELLADGNGCHKGDAGSYRFTLSTSGLGLTVAASSDTCATRAAALAGDWVRAQCPSAPQWCLGELDPGPHVSINYLPFAKWGEWQFRYGRFAYTVPVGWTNAEDSADGFVLVPTNGPDGAGIFVFTDPRAHKQGADCPHELAPNVDGSAKEIADWLRELPGLAVSRVQEVKIGGLSGTSLDVFIEPSYTRSCPWDDGGNTDLPLFLNADHEDFEWGLGVTTHMRLYVLELAPGRSIVIDIEGPDAQAWQALLPVAVPIVESFAFHQ